MEYLPPTVRREDAEAMLAALESSSADYAAYLDAAHAAGLESVLDLYDAADGEYDPAYAHYIATGETPLPAPCKIALPTLGELCWFAAFGAAAGIIAWL